MCSKLAATFALSPVLSLRYAHAQLRLFYLHSIFSGAHVRKNTRLSPRVQVQLLVPERRRLGMRPLGHTLTILESIMALAMNFPRKRNLEHTSSTMLNRVEGPRGQGKSPTGLYAYSGVLDAPVCEVRGREGGEEVREN